MMMISIIRSRRVTTKSMVCLLATLFILQCQQALAQDPSFSQFFSSPLNINPALTGNINGEWRAISNFRSQYAGPAYPYQTGTISLDAKILPDRIPENHTFGIGTMFMYDKAMDGILKATYASLNFSYNLKLWGDETEHFLGAGIGFIYGYRRIDFSRLVFGEQFNGNGFNTNLPTGESALSDMKQYISSSAGLTYTIRSEYSNFDIGFSGFHLNKPKQTFLQDENQVLPIRWVGHANYEVSLNDYLVLNTNGVYMQQSSASYFSVGGGVGRYIDEEGNMMLNAGMWYWSKNAVVPYVGFTYKNFQAGFSYDIAISKLNDAPQRPRTWELSLIYRGAKNDKPSGIIPCPWK
ncbi:MAG TPA: PorP/SprF family type IX secretion system membrane protein [Chitinophagaceae bacterium]|nr:PorP/SprF family type IX secretion system membrane protein [Chitinophagaceae bacterium]